MTCAWLVTTFDSQEQDERDYLVTEYAGRTLHIKPGHGDQVSRISTFLENGAKRADAQLTINRFLSAMAWNDGRAFITLGAMSSGAYPEDKDKPRFNYSEHRVLGYSSISRFDFEHLQNPPEPSQKLALALYREGLGSNMDFYAFLSFYKIINIRHANGHEQVAWINANLSKMWNYLAQDALSKLQPAVSDVGTYLLRQRRDAIAHAFSKPVLDPDLPTDKAALAMDSSLMQGLAEVFIQEELGVPSQHKIWREHLYELDGFKTILGESMTRRLISGETVSMTDFPPLPPLTIGLKEHSAYDCLTALSFEPLTCRAGVLIVGTDPAAQPMLVTLVLNFPAERIEVSLNRFGVNNKHEKYTKTQAICFYRFLIEYFCNGCLQIYNATTGQRLSFKTAFLPSDIDLSATVQHWNERIKELESQ